MAARIPRGKTYIPQLLALLVVLLVITGLVMKNVGVQNQKLTQGGPPWANKLIKRTSPLPTPTPIKLTPDKGVYAISQGKHAGPNVSRVIFDPLDVHKGQKLTITVSVNDSVPVTSVTGILQTDHGKIDLTFSRVNGSDRAGDWQTQVAIDDTVWYTYILTITSRSANGTATAKIAPRS